MKNLTRVCRRVCEGFEKGFHRVGEALRFGRLNLKLMTF